MGKKCKKKTQWRKLSLNEESSKSNEELSEEERTDERDNTPPAEEPVLPGPPFRRPFNPNFDYQRRPFGDYRRPFHRGGSIERFPPKFFGGRPYGPPPPPHGPPFPPFVRRRPWGRAGHLPRGHSPYSHRRWSHDESYCFDEGQPVHTVLIDNEEYTKIETPRQEVIFKKSCLDKKSDSMDSICGSSTAGLDHQNEFLHGDQGSVEGSYEEQSLEEDINQIGEAAPYNNDMFVSEPGKPPPIGVVMQQAFPGGPMMPIPVHWTPFIDPIMIPGEAALTTLGPQFTHILDSKAIPFDSAHILPVQHDANGCPITVQVKVNSEGNPIEIEPSMFPVSLNTLEPYQQEVLLRRNYDLITCTKFEKEQEFIQAAPAIAQKQDENAHPKEQTEYASCDSQYATMSETSTTPTTPSGELSDDSRCESKSKRGSSPLLLEQDSCCCSSISASSELKDEDFVPPSVLLTDPPKLSRSNSSVDESSFQCSSCELPISDEQSTNNKEDISMCHSQSSRKKEKKLKKSRSLSTESSLSSPTAKGRIKEIDDGEEPISKHQAKRTAKKLKKEKKKLNKDQFKERTETSECIDQSLSQDEDDLNNDENELTSSPVEELLNEESATKPEDVTNKVRIENNDPQIEDDVKLSTSEDNCKESISLDIESNKIDSISSETKEETSTVFEERTDCFDKVGEEKQMEDPNSIEENLTCKQGYIMIPILTPYYDPAVLYGYPVAPPENLPDRSYLRRKKKKFRRKYYQDNSSPMLLDTEMYTGETFIATPEGYMVPVESSQMFQNYSHHQYMYPPNGIAPDEGFSSAEIPHYHHERIHEHTYHKSYQLSDNAEKAMNRFLNLHEEERKEIEEVLEQLPKIEPVVESCDSGVSEIEEVAKNKQISKKAEKAKKKKLKKDSMNEEDKTIAKSKKETKKKTKTAKKTKLDVIEIQEPDFSSFSSLTLRFQVPSESLECINKVESNKINTKENNKEKSKGKKSKNKKAKRSSCLESSTISSSSTTNKLICEIETRKEEKESNCESQQQNTSIAKEDKSKKKRKKKKEKKLETEDNKSDIVSQCSIDVSSLAESIDSLLDVSQSQDEDETVVLPSQTDGSEITMLPKVFQSSEDQSLSVTETKEKHQILSSSIAEVRISQEPPTIVAANSILLEDNSVNTFIEIQPEIEMISEIQEKIIDTTPIPCNKRVSDEQTNITDLTEDVDESTIDLQGNEQTLTDLGVTEAVRRWMREVTPEKVFALTKEHQAIIRSEMIQFSDSDSDDEDEEDEIESTMPSKNVQGNPSDAPLSEKTLCVCNGRVASLYSNDVPFSSDESDDLSRSRLFSSSSSCSLRPTSSLDETIDDQRLYDPLVCSRYYKLGADVRCDSSSRESSVNPFCGEANSPMSISREILHAEKMRTLTLSEDDSPLPYHGCLSSNCPKHQNSPQSSGIGSSLASTPVTSPAHPLPELHPIKEGSVPPCRAVCCSLM